MGPASITPHTSRPSSVRVPVWEKQRWLDERELQPVLHRHPQLQLKDLFSHLVEAKDRDLAADVDAWWTDAEDALFLQPVLGVDGASGDGSGQGSWHCDGHNIQASDYQLPPGGLQVDSDKVNGTTSFTVGLSKPGQS